MDQYWTSAMKRWPVLALALMVQSPCISAAAQVYRWMDDKGEVHITDNPNQVQRTPSARPAPVGRSPHSESVSEPNPPWFSKAANEVGQQGLKLFQEGQLDDGLVNLAE